MVVEPRRKVDTELEANVNIGNVGIISPLTAGGNLKIAIQEVNASIPISITNDLSDLVASTTTPLGANASFTSPTFDLNGWGKIVGSVFTNQPGTLKIQQSNDGINFDAESVFSITSNTPTGFIVDVVGNIGRVVYTNGATAQTIFRLFVRLRRI